MKTASCFVCNVCVDINSFTLSTHLSLIIIPNHSITPTESPFVHTKDPPAHFPRITSPSNLNTVHPPPPIVCPPNKDANPSPSPHRYVTPLLQSSCTIHTYRTCTVPELHRGTSLQTMYVRSQTLAMAVDLRPASLAPTHGPPDYTYRTSARCGAVRRSRGLLVSWPGIVFLWFRGGGQDRTGQDETKACVECHALRALVSI